LKSLLAIDLNDHKNYRDLSKPIGALNPKKLLLFQKNLDENDIPYLYPIHYSSTYIVLFFLIRSHPNYFVNFQAQAFGPPDRLFISMKMCWQYTYNPGSDVKELIPEFYNSNGDFLKNTRNLNLGTTQSGHVVSDVVLPKWAKSPGDFVKILRSALESEYVSSKLNEWIDLIFGYKQRNEKALEADNLFHYLSYDDNNYINEFSDDQRESYITHLLECGQTPKKLFNDPHPRKRMRRITLPTNDMLLHNPQNQLIIQVNKLLREREKIEKNNEKLRRMKENEIELVHQENQELEKKQNDDLRSINE
jgi:factor associated with neutral sphingomyelinase activation